MLRAMDQSRAVGGGPPLDREAVRLDVWLDVTCLFKTRSDAQAACKTGRLSVNGQPAKPNRRLRVGDEIEIGRPFGRKQRVVVRVLGERHVPRAEARAMYEDLTPPLSPEEMKRAGPSASIARP